MKASDKMLLHSLDAMTPGGLRPPVTHRISAIELIVKACVLLAVFVFGLATGMVIGGL